LYLSISSLFSFATSVDDDENSSTYLNIFELETGKILSTIPLHMELYTIQRDGESSVHFFIAHNEDWIVARDIQGGIVAFDVKKNVFTKIENPESSDHRLVIKENEVSVLLIYHYKNLVDLRMQ